MNKSMDAYRALVERVDRFAVEVVGRNRRDIVCGPGCADCCGRTFSVFAVEADNLRMGFDALPEEARRIIVANCSSSVRNNPCPVLHEGTCLLYAYRPIICRTHGLPLVSEHITVLGRRVTTLCERNFVGLPDPSAIPLQYVLDLDRLNAALTAVNMMYMKLLAAGRVERVWLRDILTG